MGHWEHAEADVLLECGACGSGCPLGVWSMWKKMFFWIGAMWKRMSFEGWEHIEADVLGGAMEKF